MKAYVHVKSEFSLVLTYEYKGSPIDLAISELDFIDIEIESESLVSVDDLAVIIGNTRLIMIEAPERNGLYYYKVDPGFIRAILPGIGESHMSDRLQTKSEKRAFSRLFINEIGACHLQVSFNEQHFHLANFTVETSKISSEGYELVTLYLISVGYFDSNIIYKSVLQGGQSDVKNSLLETIRELQKRLKVWHSSLSIFKLSPIVAYSTVFKLEEFSDSLPLEDHSIDWLVDNVNELNKLNAHSPNADIVIKNSWLKIGQVMRGFSHTSTDVYENKIIHGFIISILRVLKELAIDVDGTSPRVRIRSFKEFLINCFNNLIQKSIEEAVNTANEIKCFFDNNIPVSSVIHKVPHRIQGFNRKPHYRQVLELISYSQKLFGIDLTHNRFNLEIESFDKLFEVYCFYLLRDTISNEFNSSAWIQIFGGVGHNKIAGKYQIELEGDVKMLLYYETVPECFNQLSKSHYPYNPDFFIEFQSDNFRAFLILDAKYKNYNSGNKLADDQAKLTLNYLHKIGIPNTLSAKVFGLFTISLSRQNSNRIDTIFRNEFSFTSNSEVSVIPQIGNIELSPATLGLNSNPFSKLIAFLTKQFERSMTRS